VAAVLEASQDYVSYRRAIGKLDVADPSGLSHQLVTARGKLDVVEQAPEVPVPQVQPDQGHGSSRVGFGVGRRDGLSFQELHARGTYHDIMDTDGGYARGAQIEFFRLGLRHYEFGTTRVEKFTPINILSLTPRDDFFHPMSWKIDVGWHRVCIANGNEPLVFDLSGGAGGAWSNEHKTALWYALLDGSYRIKGDLVKGYAVGAGTSIGILLDFTPSWRVHGYVRSMKYFGGQIDTPQSAGLEQRISLGHDLALRVDVSHNRELNQSYNSGSTSLLYYF
jgi:hypothetical protein